MNVNLCMSALGFIWYAMWLISVCINDLDCNYKKDYILPRRNTKTGELYEMKYAEIKIQGNVMSFFIMLFLSLIVSVTLLAIELGYADMPTIKFDNPETKNKTTRKNNV